MSTCRGLKLDPNLKRPLTEWKKIFSSYLSGRGIISRIYKELKILTIKE
jgi:hypothetical protein